MGWVGGGGGAVRWWRQNGNLTNLYQFNSGKFHACKFNCSHAQVSIDLSSSSVLS